MRLGKRKVTTIASRRPQVALAMGKFGSSKTTADEERLPRESRRAVAAGWYTARDRFGTFLAARLAGSRGAP